MPTVKRRRRVKRRRELTWNELWDLLLARRWYKGGPFESPFLRRAAWEAHREELLEDCIGEGHRPAAWWEYDAPGQPLVLLPAEAWEYDFPVMESDLVALVRLGEATPEEVAAFRHWHELAFGNKKNREELFKWHPYKRVQYEHERKLIQKLDAVNKAKRSGKDG